MSIDVTSTTALSDKRSSPTVAVLIATFNGAAYIRDQLESIIDQTVKPDIIIISDDGSTDETVNIVRGIDSSNFSNIVVNINERRLGYADNFFQAMRACDADVVFLCDQDDVWAPCKIEVMLEAFQASTSLLLTHDIAVTGRSIDDITIPSYFAALAKSSIPPSFNVKGCCAAYRQELTKIVGWPPAAEKWSHDEWLCHLSTILDVHGYVHQVLMRHRLHGKNVSGQTFTERSVVKKALRRVDDFLLGKDEVRRFVTHSVDPDVAEKLTHHAERLLSRNPASIRKTLGSLQRKLKVADFQRSTAYRRLASRVLQSFAYLVAGHYRAAGNLSGFLADIVGKRGKGDTP